MNTSEAMQELYDPIVLTSTGCELEQDWWLFDRRTIDGLAQGKNDDKDAMIESICMKVKQVKNRINPVHSIKQVLKMEEG